MSSPLHGKLGSFWYAKQNALDCTSTNHTVTVTDNANIDFTSDMTLEAWIAVGADGNGAVINKNSGELGYGLSITASDANFLTHDGTTAGDCQTATKVNTDTWIHVVGTVAGSLQHVYLNGEWEASDTTVGTDFSNGSDLVFGPTVAGSIRFGVVRLFDQAASGSEVSDLYNGKFPRSSMFGAMKGEWMFTEGTGSAVHDAGKFELDGTMANAAWVDTTYSDISSESIGTGDGSNKVFSTAKKNVDNNNLTVTEAGVTKTLGNDFTLTPKGTITFHTAPANSAAMVASYRHWPLTVEAGGFMSWSLDVTADTQDTTEFRNNGWRSFVSTLKSWTASAERHWLNPLNDIIGDKCVIRFYKDITDVDTQYLTGWGVVSGLHPAEGVDTLLDESVDLQGTGTLGTESA